MAQAPGGFDQTKWDNPEHLTPKYQIGRLAAQYRDDPASLLGAVQKLDPGATLDKDKLNLPGLLANDPAGSLIDIYRDQEGAREPAWMPLGGQQTDPAMENKLSLIAGGGRARGNLDFGPLTSGTNFLANKATDLIEQLLGGSPMENTFLRQLMGERTRG